MSETLGKKAEGVIKKWLDRPEDGYVCTRLYDQMSGKFLVSRNPCDFICYHYPNIYYIESKETEKDAFEFRMIRQNQMKSLCDVHPIKGCYGWIIVLFTTYKRAFRFNAVDIKALDDSGQKSLNIKKIDKWPIPYKELQTIPSRKEILEYTGEIGDLI